MTIVVILLGAALVYVALNILRSIAENWLNSKVTKRGKFGDKEVDDDQCN